MNQLEAIARERLEASRLVEGIGYTDWFALPAKQRDRICELGCTPWFLKADPEEPGLPDPEFWRDEPEFIDRVLPVMRSAA